ncbi:MAG: DUF1318 domain-containing protein [Planctomycetes bacterium]|nr:DUF1318 domain-containing protein [Planctomycetota bacterium]
MRNRMMVFVALLAVAVFASSAYAGDTKESIKERLEKRHPELLKLKVSGKVGEISQGYVEAIKDNDAKDKDIKKIIDEENADRKALYEIIAKEDKTTVEQVGKHAFIVKFEKAGLNEYFKGKDGVWRTKKEMLDAVKGK